MVLCHGTVDREGWGNSGEITKRGKEASELSNSKLFLCVM